MTERRDSVSVIEAAYRIEGSATDWLQGLAVAASAAFGGTGGALAFLYDASPGDWIHVHGMSEHDLPAEFAQRLFDQRDAPPESAVAMARVFATVRFASMRSQIAAVTPIFDQVMARFGIEDMACVNAIDPTRTGCVLCMPDRLRRYSPRTLYTWHRLAAHIAAGNRLRRRLEALAASGADATTSAEAVLTHTGRVEHAIGAALPRSARNALRDALVKIDATRSRREPPERAVDLWRGLVSGRWSLVEHFERDGRRYFLAHKNDPELGGQLALTTRERQVLAYAELGHSNKLIAYSLGLSVSTVSTLLSRARRKLQHT